MLTSEFFRHYRAPHADPGAGMWYGEYVGIFPTRQFVLGAAGVAVAPFDLPFGPDAEPRAARDVPGVERIPFADFETLWEAHAVPRLHAVAGLS